MQGQTRIYFSAFVRRQRESKLCLFPCFLGNRIRQCHEISKTEGLLVERSVAALSGYMCWFPTCCPRKEIQEAPLGGLTKELKGLFGPINIELNIFELCEASKLVKPSGVDKPMQSHVGLNSLSAKKTS